MKVLVSGGTGLVGRYVVEELLAGGYSVTVGARQAPTPGLFSRPVDFRPLSLDPDRDQIEAFDDAYFFVHAAFDHVPGRYRGGEGDDPEGFRRRNLDGSVRLFEAAQRAGTRRCVFLSSRAVYGELPAGTVLEEGMLPRPETLYGEVKLLAERSLAALATPGFATASLRLTGVYGNLRPNKWDGMIADYLAGRPVAPRTGTEVHGSDVGRAVRLMLETEAARISGEVFNVSDILTETREILGIVKQVTGCPHPLPEQADRGSINAMSTEKIRRLGWRGGGLDALERTLRELASTANGTARSAS